MKNSKNKFLSVLVSTTCLLSGFSAVSCFAADAQSADGVERVEVSTGVSEHIKDSKGNVFHVSDSRELTEAVKKAKSDDEICLDQDICLHKSLNIDHSLILNLNGHTITAGENGCRICVGKKTFARKDKEVIWHEGYYRTVLDTKHTYGDKHTYTDKYRQVWVPGHNECVYTDVFDYDESIDVVFKNGFIQRIDGLDGIKGKKDSSSHYNGGDGETPNAPIEVVSGILRLNSVIARGGNGGRGGKGGYQSLWHIPFFGGGNAGNGGDGGNGGAALSVEPNHGTCSLDSKSELIKGRPGRGGKAGKPNPNYWILSGSKGCDGEDGE